MDIISDIKGYLTVNIIILFVVLCVLSTIAYFIRNNIVNLRKILLQYKIWEIFSKQTINTDNIADYEQPTKHVFKLVNKKIIQSEDISQAKDFLSFYLESIVYNLRSLSYAASLAGLFGTVCILYFTLASIKENEQFQLSLLNHVYLANVFAIFVAILAYSSFYWYRSKTDQFFSLVVRRLDDLDLDLPPGVNPTLILALEKVAEKYQKWGEKVQAKHLENVKVLFSEMKEVGAAIKTMVETTLESRRQREEEIILPLLQDHVAKIELLSQRLDNGFQVLARPFAEGIPIIERWDQSTANLTAAVNKLAAADIPGVVSRLQDTTSKLTAAISSLPELVRQSLQGVDQLIAASARQAFHDGLEEAVRARLTEISGIVSILSQTVGKLQDSLAQLPDLVFRGLDKSGQELTKVLTGIVTNIQGLQSSLDSLPLQLAEKCVPLWHQESIEPLSRALDAAFSKRLENLPPLLRPIQQDLATQFDQAIQNQQQALAQEIRTLDGNLRTVGNTIPPVVREVQAVQSRLTDLKTSSHNIISTLQNILAVLQQKSSEPGGPEKKAEGKTLIDRIFKSGAP
jgi:hypothetical protein